VKRRKVYLAMKKVTVLTACALSIGMAVGVASADVSVTGEMSGGVTGTDNNGISWQYIAGVDIDGTSHNVFRLYADRNYMDASGSGLDIHEVLEVKGTADKPSSALTNGVIFKDGFAPANGPASAMFNGAFANLKYTSYTTIGDGLENAEHVWLGDQGWLSNGFDISSAAGGTWAHLPGTTSLGFANNDVAAMGLGNTLLMQLTTTGDTVTYDLEIGVRTNGVGKVFDEAEGVISIPAPGALALLGIAGLASRRRRRA
jgi:hypothetical protein